MKAVLGAALATAILAGCGKRESPLVASVGAPAETHRDSYTNVSATIQPNGDEVALQPYAHIASGSVIVLQTRAIARDAFNRFRREVIVTNPCVLEDIHSGVVWVINSGLGREGYAGSLVKSIQLK